MKMIPIVAVVSEDAFHALNDLLSSIPEPPDAWREVMDRNGWTIDSVIAGDLIANSLDVPAMPDPYPKVNDGA